MMFCVNCVGYCSKVESDVSRNAICWSTPGFAATNAGRRAIMALSIGAVFMLAFGNAKREGEHGPERDLIQEKVFLARLLILPF